MQRMSLIAAVVLCLAAATSQAAPGQLGLGADVGLMLRDEAAGNRTAVASLSPRLTFGLTDRLNLVGVYGFSFHQEGSLLTAASQYHRLCVRPELLLPMGAARLALGAGPSLQLTHTNYFDKGAAVVGSTSTRLGAVAGIALDVPIDRLTLRAGVDAFFTPGRTDLVIALGGLYSFGASK
jgi:hypothetical protein